LQFGIIRSPYCECGYLEEGSRALFARMPEMQEQRRRLQEAVGTGRMKIGILLGGPTKIKYTMAYINETGRSTS
jgi:hypothetical protein